MENILIFPNCFANVEKRSPAIKYLQLPTVLRFGSCTSRICLIVFIESLLWLSFRPITKMCWYVYSSVTPTIQLNQFLRSDNSECIRMNHFIEEEAITEAVVLCTCFHVRCKHELIFFKCDLKPLLFSVHLQQMDVVYPFLGASIGFTHRTAILGKYCL
jgi:hypothetical protein